MTGPLIIAQAQGGAPAWSMLIWLLIIPLMYFMVIRPNQKSQKEAKKFRDALKAGDQVISAGGLYGKVVNVEDSTITLEIAPKTRVRVMRSQIIGKQPAAAASSTETTEEKDDSDAS